MKPHFFSLALILAGLTAAGISGFSQAKWTNPPAGANHRLDKLAGAWSLEATDQQGTFAGLLTFNADGTASGIYDELPTYTPGLPIIDLLAIGLNTHTLVFDTSYSIGTLSGVFDDFHEIQVPEPSTILIMGAGLVLFSIFILRKRIII